MAQAYWLVHRPPSPAALMLALRLLHALAGEAAERRRSHLPGSHMALLRRCSIPCLVAGGSTHTSTPSPLSNPRPSSARQPPAGTPAAAWSAAAHAGTLYLLSLLLPPSPVTDESDRALLETGRAAAASLLGRLLAQPLHGPRVGLVLSKFLPPGLVALVQVGQRAGGGWPGGRMGQSGPCGCRYFGAL